MKSKIIGIGNNDDNYFLYFRDSQGFKHRIVILNAIGILDFYNCSDIPNMTDVEYNNLPTIVVED